MYNQARKEARPSKMINQVEMSCGPGEVDEEKVGALNWDNKKKSPKKGNSRGSGGAKMGIKYFNCGKDGHGINDC